MQETKNTIHALFTGPTILFTHLKIILLQYFQFLVLAKINCIQTDPYFKLHDHDNANFYKKSKIKINNESPFKYLEN